MANNEVFTVIQKIFDQKHRQNHFKEVNQAENFTNAKGVVSEYTPWDTSLEKLRRKYTTLKAEWREISDRWKNGSGLTTKKEPRWYEILNPVFSEKNETFHLAEGRKDLSFNLQNDSIDDDFERQLADDENNFQKSDGESSNEEWEQNVIRRAPTESPVNGNKKLVVAPHRKRNIVRSQNQVLSKIAKELEDLAGAQIKTTKLTISRTKKDMCFFLNTRQMKLSEPLNYKGKEACKNREDHLRLAQIYASVRPTNYLSQGDQWHVFAYQLYMQNLSGNSKNV